MAGTCLMGRVRILSRVLTGLYDEELRPFGIESMLRIHYLQQWFALSDPAMEEALHDMPVFREFTKLGDVSRLPDETTILRFRHLLEKHDLATDMLRVVHDN